MKLTPASSEILLEADVNIHALAEIMLGLSTTEGITCNITHSYINKSSLMSYVFSLDRRTIILGHGNKVKVYPFNTNITVLNRILSQLNTGVTVKVENGNIIVRR